MISSPYKTQNQRGQTALYYAAFEGHTEIVALLLDLDRSVAKLQDEDGFTALHRASALGHASVVGLLLDADPGLVEIEVRFKFVDGGGDGAYVFVGCHVLLLVYTKCSLRGI